MGLKKKLAALVGLVLISVSVANVELGALMNLDPPQKLILARAQTLVATQMIFRKIWTQVKQMPVS